MHHNIQNKGERGVAIYVSSDLESMQRVTEMLETNDFVRCLMIDFSKAFDTVDPVVLMSKLVQSSTLTIRLPSHS